MNRHTTKKTTTTNKDTHEARDTTCMLHIIKILSKVINPRLSC